MNTFTAIRFGLLLMAFPAVLSGCGADAPIDAVAAASEPLSVPVSLSTSMPAAIQPPVANAVATPLQAELLANDGVPGDAFGYSVAMAGDMAIVGNPADEIGGNVDQGSAYVFTRNGMAWTQQAKLVASDGSASHWFGHSVALYGDTAIVGAPLHAIGANAAQGAAYVFTQSGGVWVEQAKLIADDGAADDFFGTSVALSGDTAIVGAYRNNAWQGAAYVFTRSGGVWSQQAKLIATDGTFDDAFGRSVTLSGDMAIIGAPLDDIGGSANRGSAYVFTRSGTVWAQQAKLIANDGYYDDYFGASVALSADTVIVGAAQDGVFPNGYQGSAYVFTQSGTVWTQQAKLIASDGAANDWFGTSVALSGDVAIVGSLRDDVSGINEQGSAYVFTRSGTLWTQQAKLTENKETWFGLSVALSGNTVLVGACGGTQGPDNGGIAYVFTHFPVGASCTTAAECPSGFCVDGVCCDSACTQPCQACSAALKNQGVDGVCGPIPAGVAPPEAADCPAAPYISCGFTGVCDGSGACQFWAAGTSCGASCVGTKAIHSACTGSGICAASQTECAPYLCKNNQCPTSCSTTADCASTAYCDPADLKCKAKLPLGAACGTNGAICVSGNCVDGVCCNSTCAGACQACTAAKKGSGGDGTCGSVPAGTTCGPDQCFGNVSKKLYCDTFGTCVPEANGVDCQTYACDVGLGACPMSCSSDADCIPAAHCAQGVCVVDEPTGTSCTADAQCTSGYCSDGFCCDRDCTGPCRACSAIKTGQPNGTCVDYAFGTDPDDECADNLACDGAGGCKKPDGDACLSGADCITGFCADGVCCNSACGGDCQACSVAAGASVDGVCAPRSATTVCRVSVGICDTTEMCDGTSPDCPIDSKEPAGTKCRSIADECDAPESCNGVSNNCPPDDWAANGTACSQGVCMGGTCTSLMDAGTDGGDGEPTGAGGSISPHEQGACAYRASNATGNGSTSASLTVVALLLLLSRRRAI